MPAGDGTGPMGMGPMTGRGAGYCGGFSMPGYVSSAPVQGMGFRRGWGQGGGRGRGRGWCRSYYPAGNVVNQFGFGRIPNEAVPSAEHELQVLEAQAGRLEGALEDIKRRIAELEKDSAS